ncbi:MAG: PIN domain-containing protein [Phycisphaeraceae bacterium]
MILIILRGLFVFLAASVAVLFLLSNQEGLNITRAPATIVSLVMALTLAISVAVIVFDIKTPNKKLSAYSGVFLGLIAGLIVAYALSFVVDLVGVLFFTDQQAVQGVLEGIKVLVGVITSYLCISLVLQTKDDFRFVIPYVEFAKEIRGNRPTILDTSILVDGRVLDIIETHVLQGAIVVPKFVLNELQTIADSADKLRRARGRRGLDVLQKLQDSTIVEVSIPDADDAEGINVDQKLISLAQQMQGRVMTNDYNLNKVATLRGVDVINLNDLAKAMRPVVLPGEHMRVRIVKPGEGPAQGVGYLDDGTMVVVEGGRQHLSEEVQLEVTSTLQTSAGRMIFGRYEGEPPAEKTQDGAPRSPAPAGAAQADGGSTPESDHARLARPRTGRNPRRGA